MNAKIGIGLTTAVLITCFGCGQVHPPLAVPNLGGNWKGKDGSLIIYPGAAGGYKITAAAPSGFVNGQYAGTYNQGKMHLSAPACGEMSYVEKSDTIVFCGSEYRRVAQ
jgi:hypothetical protein